MAEGLGDWEIARLTKTHGRDNFGCGEVALDTYLKRFARQNDERDLTRTYVATLPGSRNVVAHYVVRSGEVVFEQIPEKDRKRLPRYPVPVVHLARLAVDRTQAGRGLGELMLLHALERAMEIARDVGVMAVEVFAKNNAARRFYGKYGFKSLLDDQMHMYLPIETIRNVLAR